MPKLDHSSLDRFAESLKAKGKQPATIESYRRDASRFLDYLQTQKLSAAAAEPETLVAYSKHLSENNAEKINSVRRTIIGVRQFYRFLEDEKILQQSPFEEVPIPERSEKLPDTLKRYDLDRVVAKTCSIGSSPNLMAARNALIIACLAWEGLKANELINLEWQDILPSGNQISLRIPGTKARSILVCSETATILILYQKCFEDFLQAHSLSKNHFRHIFISFKGRDGSLPLPNMTRHGLKFIIYEIGTESGLKHLNTELLRHYAVNHLLASGRSPEAVMAHLGLRRIGNVAKHMAAQLRQ